MLRGGMSHQPDNLFAGTQVVSLVEVRGTNNSLVHPRGAVGVVTYTGTWSGSLGNELSMSGSYTDIANGHTGSWSANIVPSSD